MEAGSVPEHLPAGPDGRACWQRLVAGGAPITAAADERAVLGHLMEARELLEPRLAWLAAQRATAAEIRRIRLLADQLDAADGGDEIAAAALEFHRALTAASHNRVLVQASVLGLVAKCGRLPGEALVPQHAAFWHRRIAAALEDRDPNAAANATRLHIRQDWAAADG